MGKSKRNKRFDKKNAASFHLVHRSSRDPLAADENASKYVLQPNFKGKQHMSEQLEGELDGYIQQHFPELNLDAILEDDNDEFERYDDLDVHESPPSQSSLPHDYDYSTHLKSIDNSQFVNFKDVDPNQAITDSIRQQYCFPEPDETKSVKSSSSKQPREPKTVVDLPKEVFASTYEEDTGILERDVNIRGENVDATEDFFFALEDGPNDEVEELDDMFVQIAMQEDDIVDDEDLKHEYVPDEAENVDGNEMFGDVEFMKEYAVNKDFKDSESAFDSTCTFSTNYASQPTQQALDEQFSHALRQYEDLEDCYDEDADGPVDMHGLLTGEFDRVLNQFLEDKKKAYKMDPKIEANIISHQHLERFAREDKEAEEDHEETASKIESMFQKPDREKWDCESVVSTYTNVENHPNLIERKVPRKQKVPKPDWIKLSKTGFPVPPTTQDLECVHFEKQDTSKLDVTQDSTKLDEDQDRANLGEKRRKDESKEERKLRKQAVKEQRKLNRQRKKKLKQLFKDEHDTEAKNSFNAHAHHQSAVRLL